MKLNRKWLMVIALVMSLTMATAGTLAYLTDRDTVENTFTMGSVDIEVEEEFPPEGKPIKPGEEVDKNAKIVNEGTNPAWVWMTVSVPEGLKDYVTLNWTAEYAGKATGPVVENGEAVWTVLVDEQLPVDGETNNILDSVTLSPLVDFQDGKYVVVEDGNATDLEGIENGKMIVTVNGYATQVEGLDTVEDAYEAYQGQWEERLPNGIYTLQDLISAAKNGGEYFLAADLHITEDDAFYYNSYITAVMADMTLDLNDHDIIVDADMGKSADGAILFYVYNPGVSLTIVGNGDVIAKHDAFIFFPRGVSEGVYIYGGNYYNVDDTSGTQNDINAIVYSQTNNNIHIYGGTFTFKNVNGRCGGFNVYDNSGAEIVLHEGVLLSNSAYYQGSDANEIHLAEGCELVEVEIDGVTWYQVTKTN